MKKLLWELFVPRRLQTPLRLTGRALWALRLPAAGATLLAVVLSFGESRFAAGKAIGDANAAQVQADWDAERRDIVRKIRDARARANEAKRRKLQQPVWITLPEALP